MRPLATSSALLLLLLLAGSGNCWAQHTSDTTRSTVRYGVDLERHLSVMLGYNFWRAHYLEAGVAINQYGRVGHHPAAWACFVSSEIQIAPKPVIGPKIGAWIGGGSGGLALGINLIYYTNFDKAALRLRPEIGMGFGRWKMVYGYNLAINNHNFSGVNKSNLGLAWLIGFKQVKTIRQ